MHVFVIKLYCLCARAILPPQLPACTVAYLCLQHDDDGVRACLRALCVCSHGYCACVCLQAALRRLAAGCPDSIEAADHQQLIKPRLVDSFLLCSNMEESFV